jgi:hypothetical protein
MRLLFSQLWCRAPVGCCIVDGWVDRWCSDVSLVWRNQTAMPPPSYITWATASSCADVFKYYTTKPRKFYTTTYAAPSHYTDALKYYSAPSYYTTKATECYITWLRMLPHLLHRGSQVLPCSRLLIAPIFLNTSVPRCYTEAPADYSTKTVEYYTEAAKYFSAPIYASNWGGQVLRSLHLLHRSCSFVLRWTEILQWCSSPLHHDLRYA